jgi:hypothetical protein
MNLNFFAMKHMLFLWVFLFYTPLMAQELAEFTIPAGEAQEDAPVAVSLKGIPYNTDEGSLVLYEVRGEKEKRIASQLETGHTAWLWFILKELPGNNPERQFVLKREKGEENGELAFGLKQGPKDLEILAGQRPVLRYRFGMTYPPKGVNSLYKRSGYIHPLWSPGGEVLTTIQPADHSHHYGIWGPWTKTHIDGRGVDFWNLGKGQGTIRFAAFLSQEEGEIFSGFKALQQHIDFGARGEDRIAMNEILDVRVWNVNEKIWMIDYTTSLNSPLENGILLDAYRYGGGIGYRATEKWHKDNCIVLTSDNKTRIGADGTSARWCIVEGKSSVKEGRSGILFLSHPANRMHPEPMRVWPPDANGGRGDMFFEFTPIRHNDWELKPFKTYTLKYRLIVFDGGMDAEKAEKYWKSFANTPELK